jgi:tetratricopeptide (TPR) repeat protein
MLTPSGLKSKKPRLSRPGDEVAQVYDRSARLSGPMARQPEIAVTTIRAMAFAVLLATFVVGWGLYDLVAGSGRVQSIAPLESNAAAGNALIDVESWPICTTMGAFSDGLAWAPLDPDFAAGKQALAVGDWNGAIKALGSAALRDPRNADIQNYLGYAHRRLRQLQSAVSHYRLALALNPRHRSAHEHLGEAHLTFGNLPQAEEHLAALERICLIPCEEYDDLKRAIAKFRRLASR